MASKDIDYLLPWNIYEAIIQESSPHLYPRTHLHNTTIGFVRNCLHSNINFVVKQLKFHVAKRYGPLGHSSIIHIHGKYQIDAPWA